MIDNNIEKVFKLLKEDSVLKEEISEIIKKLEETHDELEIQQLLQTIIEKFYKSSQSNGFNITKEEIEKFLVPYKKENFGCGGPWTICGPHYWGS